MANLPNQRIAFLESSTGSRRVLWVRKAWLAPAPLLLIVTAALLAPFPVSAEKPQDLRAQGYVNDFAAILSPGARTKLTALCTELDQKAHAQIAIVTIHTLDGDSIEDFSISLAQKWGVGPKTDRGVLILLAVNDHQYRVEVGYGLEAILPDGKVGGFGRDMKPALRQGDYSGALLQLTGSIASVIAQASGVTLSETPPAPNPLRSRDHAWSPGLVIFIVILFLLFGGLRSFLPFGGFGRRRGIWWGGGPWIGGGFGAGGFGGGGGGGGFGGFGGGSFGGGGASGSW